MLLDGEEIVIIPSSPKSNKPTDEQKYAIECPISKRMTLITIKKYEDANGENITYRISAKLVKPSDERDIRKQIEMGEVTLYEIQQSGGSE